MAPPGRPAGQRSPLRPSSPSPAAAGGRSVLEVDLFIAGRSTLVHVRYLGTIILLFEYSTVLVALLDILVVLPVVAGIAVRTHARRGVRRVRRVAGIGN